MSDDELVDAVQRGDHRVAYDLYARLIRIVDRTLYRVFGRRDSDHDDLVQTVFEQIVITLCRRSYTRGCSLGTWAATIASHIGLNALRARRRERRLVDRDALADVTQRCCARDLDGKLAARSELTRVRTELLEMKPAYAEAVFLHDVLGHELPEIALMTRISLSAAQSRLVRGRRELFRRLDRNGLV